MKYKQWIFIKWFIILLGALIPIGLSIGLAINITNGTNIKNDIANDINKNLSTSNIIKNNNHTIPYWDLKKINYIRNNFNYKQQYKQIDYSSIFNNVKSNYLKKYINKITTSSNLNINANKPNIFNEIQINNLTAMVNNLINNYSHRYIINNSINNWSQTRISNPVNYVGDNNVILNSNQVFNFSLDPVNNNDKYNLAAINIPPTSNISFSNNFYNIYSNTYYQIVNNNAINNTRELKQIIVDWSNVNNHEFIATSTLDYWIRLLLQFKDVARIVVKPANLIIYRNNNLINKYNISLNTNTAKKLLWNNPIDITIENWMDACINTDPNDNFDFRKENYKFLNNIRSINIPKIITINDSEYINHHTYNSCNKIVNNILFAKNQFINNRNWGNDYYSNLEQLMISMDSYNEVFDIKNCNNLNVANTYTNAPSNTGMNNNQGPVFGNQFFTLPNLVRLNTNNINIFMQNFKTITYLTLYKIYDKNFSEASYLRYKNILLNFVCESTINNSYCFSLNQIFNHLNNNPIDEININNNINYYFNYFNQNRDINNQKYQYFDSYQNQWLSNNILINNMQAYRYDFLYGIYDFLTKIIFPFSLINKIEDYNNPLFLGNNLISRFVDNSSQTIVYNSLIKVNNQEKIYPEFLLNNDNFSHFIDQKLASSNTANNRIIDLTFQDWVNNAWTGISNDLDICGIMEQKQVTFNEFNLPNIIIMNVANIKLLNNKIINDNLITSLIIIILIVFFSFIEIIILITIIRMKNKNKWLYSTLQLKYNF